MKQKIYFYSFSKNLFDQVAGAIPAEIADLNWIQSEHQEFTTSALPLVIVDSNRKDRVELLRELSEKKVFTVLLLDEDKAEQELDGDLGTSLENGHVDDILLTPIRTVEVLSKLKHVAHLARVNEMSSMNTQLKSVIDLMEEDLLLAQKIQKNLIPEKFKQVPGFNVNHKYLSGFKSGGDYLDFFEFSDSTHVGLMMSDSTGYGLSSAFMALMFRLAARLTNDEIRSPAAVLEKIFSEVRLGMKPKETLSVFYGILNRKTFDLTYASFGNVRFYLGQHGTSSDLILKNVLCDPLKADSPWKCKDQHAELRPGDRMALMSDGFHEAFSQENEISESFSKNAADPVGLINDFTFRIKSKLESPDDLPKQDCSLMVIDVEKRAMRLAK